MNQIHIPNSNIRRPVSLLQAQANRDRIGRDLRYLPNATREELPHLPGELVQKLQTHRRQPGILDNLLAAQSHDEACDIWTSFQNQNPEPANKTVRKAMRILTAHLEGRIV